MNFDGFKAHTLAELDALADEQMDRWLETRKEGIAEYDPKTNVIRLHLENMAPYEIIFEYLQTAPQLLNMIFHLSGKNWCKGSVLIDFIHCLEWAIREKEDQSLWQFYKLDK
jgi:hypothetical protein